MPSLPVVSKEYLYFTDIQAFNANSPDAAADPTVLPIQVALVTSGEPTEPDWNDAEWVNATTARILTGAGGVIQPAVGSYRIWLRVTGAFEQPEREIGVLNVT